MIAREDRERQLCIGRLVCKDRGEFEGYYLRLKFMF